MYDASTGDLGRDRGCTYANANGVGDTYIPDDELSCWSIRSVYGKSKEPIYDRNFKRITNNKEKYIACIKPTAKSFVEIGNVYNGNSSELMKVEKQNVFQKMFLPIVSKINGTKKFKANVLSKFLLESENMRNEKMTVINKTTRENTLKYRYL